MNPETNAEILAEPKTGSCKIAVFGLGYVGTVSSACFAQLGHQVLGVDISTAKVDQINAGKSPIVEAGLDEILQDTVSKELLSATTDYANAIGRADISLICVGTPSRANGSLDTSHVESVLASIGEALKTRPGQHTVVVRSTLLPGTTENLLKPILEKASGKKCGTEIGLAYNPEFLRESTAVRDFIEPPYTIIGGSDAESIETASAIYADIDADIHKVAMAEAEMIKYTANAFHALKITFANEIGNFAKSMGVNGHTVMDLICRDTKLNISKVYMKPGFAFGGSCLPKDLRAILYASRTQDIELPLLQSLQKSNALQIQRGLDMVMAQKSKKIGVLGFSFKAGTDDLRESPIVRVIEELLGRGYSLKLYDKNVQLIRLMGANRSYIDTHIPHVGELMVDTLEEVIEESDTLIIGNSSPEFAKLFQQPLENKSVIDLVRLPHIPAAWIESMGDRYHGICW